MPPGEADLRSSSLVPSSEVEEPNGAFGLGIAEMAEGGALKVKVYLSDVEVVEGDAGEAAAQEAKKRGEADAKKFNSLTEQFQEMKMMLQAN